VTVEPDPFEDKAAEELVDALMAVSRVVIGQAARAVSGAGDISLPMYRALMVLTTRAPMRIVDLAEVLGVNPSSATRVVDRLVRRSLARKARPRGGDRRTHVVRLTDEGRTLVTEIVRRRRAMLDDVIKPVPTGLYGPLVAGLRAIADGTDEADEGQMRAALAAFVRDRPEAQ